MSQSELARRVSVRQSTINHLIRGASRSSTHLHRIASALGTTPAYLSGETDDPDENAPPPVPAPTIQFVTMQVALPSEAALARMFEGLLEVVDLSAPKAEVAYELAQLLPTGLSQLKGRLIEGSAPPPRTAPPLPEAAEALATADRGPPR